MVPAGFGNNITWGVGVSVLVLFRWGLEERAIWVWGTGLHGVLGEWYGTIQIRQHHVDNDKDLEVSTTSELFALACGPTWTLISINSCVVDGVRYVVHSRDERCITQNCGICSPGPDGEMYYGQLQEILEFKYLLFKVVLFRVSLNDLDNATLHIDGQSTKTDVPPDIIDVVDEDDDITNDEDAIPHDLADSYNEDLINVDDDVDVARSHDGDGGGEDRPPPHHMSVDVARSHDGDGGGEDRPPPHHVPSGCMGCFANRDQFDMRPHMESPTGQRSTPASSSTCKKRTIPTRLLSRPSIGNIAQAAQNQKNRAKSTVISRQGSRSLARLRDEMFESGGACGSGGCRDDEEAADHQDDQDEDGDVDTYVGTNDNGPYGTPSGTPVSLPVESGDFSGFFGREAARVKVGPYGGKCGTGWSFALEDGWKLTKITFLTTEDYVYYIQFTYLDNNNVEHISPKYGGYAPPDAKRNTVTIADGHKLTLISGTVGSDEPYCDLRITSLCFKVNNGPYGTPSGTPFSVLVTSGDVSGFFGYCGAYLESLGVIISPYDAHVMRLNIPRGLKRVICSVLKGSRRTKAQRNYGALGRGAAQGAAFMNMSTNDNGPYGTPSGTHFSLPVDSGDFSGFFGREVPVLNSLGAMLSPSN
uniref:Jacalin-type lectin domain-containing protein n=1 Tax=Tanacetum cinerariifolium TaxID=118510 RepID=A0A6L2NMX3_TANCI|nr:hypothetical protein [Tanacetum cinerariifolium]